MDQKFSELIIYLNKNKIIPIIYGSVGVSLYLKTYRDLYSDIDLLIPNYFLKDGWRALKDLMLDSNFILTDENEHEFTKNSTKVGFADKNILIRDDIVSNLNELVAYPSNQFQAFTLTPEQFLKAYEFSSTDGYRINIRGKKDKEVINLLQSYITKISHKEDILT
ncbi:MAG: hypothetical protein Q8O46_03505 [bacterium]|nr:hypothetical protein [bacterium]